MATQRKPITALLLMIGAVALLLAMPRGAEAETPWWTQPVASVNFDAYPWGGGLNPLQPSGFQASIPNPGSITISNAVTGAIVYSKALSWPYDPDARYQDYWAFDAQNLPAGLYNYCGAIAPGDGYAGWSGCQSYGTKINELFKFLPGRNSGSGFGVPLQLDPALIGQTMQVNVARAVWRRGGYTGWRKTSNTSYTVQLQAGQVLQAGKRLKPNQKVTLTTSFPSLLGVVPDGPTDKTGSLFWVKPDSCRDVLHTAISPRLLPRHWSSHKASKADLKGQPSDCSRYY